MTIGINPLLFSGRVNTISSPGTLHFAGKKTPKNLDNVRVFTGRANPELAAKISKHLKLPLSAIQVQSHPDGEVEVKVQTDVTDKDVFVIQPTCAPVNDNLVELLIMVDAFKRAGARTITAVMPYYGYARQDRPKDPVKDGKADEIHEPISGSMVSKALKAVGVDRVVTVDLHSGQTRGFFDGPFDNIPTLPLAYNYFSKLIRDRKIKPDELVFVSPDASGVSRLEPLANALGAGIAFTPKKRITGSQVESGRLVGNVNGKIVVFFDDIISTAGSVKNGVQAVLDGGTREIWGFFSHGVLCGPAADNLKDLPFKKIITSDTIPLPERCKMLGDKITQLSVSEMLAEAIRRIGSAKSVNALWGIKNWGKNKVNS